ncbi:MAG: YeeE/YedE family protein [Deltaproteobacteria bacterium]|nr:YeeE/YedE family protein [Deltaproteobacteria bacterium]
MRTLKLLGFGILFGFILSRIGATDYTAIAEMFLLRDYHLMGVMGTAIVTAGIGLRLLQKSGIRTAEDKPVELCPKPASPGNLWGGLLFGAGWGITGTCPGTALSQLGEGKVMAAFTVLGIFLGTMLYIRTGKDVESWLKGSARRSESPPKPVAA